ncbi:MAG: hypothetical protein RR580_02935, partial [Christensenellaceae bacterium]
VKEHFFHLHITLVSSYIFTFASACRRISKQLQHPQFLQLYFLYSQVSQLLQNRTAKNTGCLADDFFNLLFFRQPKYSAEDS